MTERLVLAAVIVAAAAVIAVLVQRRRPQAPTQGTWPVPRQLDRDDFDRTDAAWLIAVFTSASCDSCAGVLAACAPLAGPAVAVVDIEVKADAELHRRYDIEAVPTLVVADRDGVVRASFVGPPGVGELWSTVAAVREGAPDDLGASGSGW